MIEENNAEKQEKAKLQAIIEYQKGQYEGMQQKYFDALKEKERALHLSTPTVDTPRTSPALAQGPAAEKLAAAPMGAPPSIDPASTGSARLSERLPDPDKFEGDRKDFRRFSSQIQEKMNVNYDRFPTPQTRMTYVTNRLKGAPYAQILPYIHRGVCQLSDYHEILDILERAFGDPNRTRNARDQLYRLRQGNKEFSIFFAEFQRLALEGEMPEAALPTMLEQAVNRELKSMLLHHEPPSGDYHQLAAFLQNLENRRVMYESNVNSRSYAAAARPTASPLPYRPNAMAMHREPTRRPATPPPVEHATDAMDLSLNRRRSPPTRYGTNRRERGECFRCGSREHLIRDCPHPDNRPMKAHAIHPLPRPRSPTSPEPAVQPAMGRYENRSPEPRSPSPLMSTNGVSLV
jgi:hypothetical protein